MSTFSYKPQKKGYARTGTGVNNRQAELVRVLLSSLSDLASWHGLRASAHAGPRPFVDGKNAPAARPRSG